MYPLGHFAISNIISYLYNLNKERKINIPLLWIVSILPDFDLLFPFLVHRGPTHSMITMSVFFIPLCLYNRRWTIYFLTILSHSLIGDYFVGYIGVQLIWPLSATWYSAPILVNPRGLEIIFEIFFFIFTGIILFKKIITKFFLIEIIRR